MQIVLIVVACFQCCCDLNLFIIAITYFGMMLYQFTGFEYMFVGP